MRRCRSRALLTLALMILGLLSLTQPARALGGTASAAGAETTATATTTVAAPGDQGRGRVRIAHLAPVPAAGDVYVVRVDGQVRVNDLPVGAVSDYFELAAGTYVLDLHNARAPKDATSEHQLALTVEPGGWQTVLLYGPHPDVRSLIMDDTIAPPAPGTARVRVANVLAPDTAVRVLDGDGGTLMQAAPDAASDYVELPEGTHTLRLSDVKGDVLASPVSVTLRAGDTHALVATNGHGGQVELHSMLESAAATAPTRIDTGAGGSAASATAAGSAGGTQTTGIYSHGTRAAGAGLAIAGILILTVAAGLNALRTGCTIGTIRWLEPPKRHRPEQEHA